MKVIATVSWPKGASRDGRVISKVTVTAPSTGAPQSYAILRWPNHDAIEVTEADQVRRQRLDTQTCERRLHLAGSACRGDDGLHCVDADGIVRAKCVSWSALPWPAINCSSTFISHQLRLRMLLRSSPNDLVRGQTEI